MGSLCLLRGPITLNIRLGIYACNSGKFVDLSRFVLTGVPRPGWVQIKKYSQETVRKYDPVQYVCYSLSHRTLLEIIGQDAKAFFQGIITNDMRLFEDPEHRAMYAHMLNVQGRSLYDIMLYSLKESTAGCRFLMECDSTVKDSILRHLMVYKIRRQVNINHCQDLSIWAVLPEHKHPGQELVKPEITSPQKALVWESDPRAEAMGWRLVIDRQVDPLDVVSCQQGDTEEYHKHRYAIGFPEGVKDIPPGVALPLESNLAYMRGISFSKGCYIGQELTARTHHTGVVRKRLMPVRLSAPVGNMEEGAPLRTQFGKPAGKHRAGVGTLGISLIRTCYAREVLTLTSSDNATVTLEASVPQWWPQDSMSK